MIDVALYLLKIGVKLTLLVLLVRAPFPCFSVEITC